MPWQWREWFSFWRQWHKHTLETGLCAWAQRAPIRVIPGTGRTGSERDRTTSKQGPHRVAVTGREILIATQTLALTGTHAETMGQRGE